MNCEECFKNRHCDGACSDLFEANAKLLAVFENNRDTGDETNYLEEAAAEQAERVYVDGEGNAAPLDEVLS